MEQSANPKSLIQDLNIDLDLDQWQKQLTQYQQQSVIHASCLHKSEQANQENEEPNDQLESIPERQTLENQKTFKIDIEEDDSQSEEEQNKINFDQLCPKQNYVQSENCYVCDTKFTGIFSKNSKICKFCGRNVCEKCSKRKRQDPQNEQEFVRICDKCHYGFIKNQLIKKHQKRKDKRVKRVKMYEEKIEIETQTQLRLDSQIEAIKNEQEKTTDYQIARLEDLESQNILLQAKNQTIDDAHTKLHTQNQEIKKKQMQYDNDTDQEKRILFDQEQRLNERQQTIVELDKQISNQLKILEAYQRNDEHEIKRLEKIKKISYANMNNSKNTTKSMKGQSKNFSKFASNEEEFSISKVGSSYLSVVQEEKIKTKKIDKNIEEKDNCQSCSIY